MSTWWVSRSCPWGHSATVQVSLQGKLGPWPYCHRAQHHPSQDASHHCHSFKQMSSLCTCRHSGTFGDQQLYCSCMFLVLYRSSRISLPWKCQAFWAMWSTTESRMEIRCQFEESRIVPLQSISRIKRSACAGACWCSRHLVSMYHPGSCSLPAPAPSPGDTDKVSMSHLQPAMNYTSVNSADQTLWSYR